MRIARVGGYDRVVSAAWLLVEAVFGITTPGGAGQGQGGADRATRRLVDLSLAALAAPAELASAPTLGWLVRRSHVQFAFRRAWRDRLALLRHLFTSPRSFDAGQQRL